MVMEKVNDWKTNVCYALQRQWDIERTFDLQALLGSPYHIQPIFFVDSSGDSALPGPGALSKFLGS